MNIEQAKLLARMANHVRTLQDCHKANGSWFADTQAPGCMVCNAVRAGIISKDDACNSRADHPEGFSERFGVSIDDSNHILFHVHINWRAGDSSTTGENYYQASKDILVKHGYAYLLEPEEVIPIHVPQEVYKDQFTKAEAGFDWRKPGAVNHVAA